MKGQPGPPVRGSRGTTLATWNFGGRGPDLLMLHATGFHGRCYAPVAAELARHFHCWALDQRGHGRSEPAPDGDYDWRYFTADTLAAIDQLGLDRPFAFGHSLGGAVALLAEEARPGTFAAFHLFEPIVLTPATARAADRNRLLSNLARRRRSHFPSRADALINYASKLPFARFRADALLAYVDAGLSDTRDGTVELSCATEAEARVYEGALHAGAFGRLTAVAAPVTLACGQREPDVNLDHLNALADHLERATVEEYEGLSHFGPFEDPARVARGVHAAIGVPARSA